MASLQEEIFSQVSREKFEKKLFVLIFRESYVSDFVQLFMKNHVAFVIDFKAKIGFCRLAFPYSKAPQSIFSDLCNLSLDYGWTFE